MEEAIEYVRAILNNKKEELLEHVLIDGFTDLPKECRFLHLSCLKVFQMFFNSSNRYDSDTAMLDDIGKALYVPLDANGSKKKPNSLAMSLPDHHLPSKSTVMKGSAIKYHNFGRPSKHFIRSYSSINQLSSHTYWRVGNWKTTLIMPRKFNFRFI